MSKTTSKSKTTIKLSEGDYIVATSLSNDTPRVALYRVLGLNVADTDYASVKLYCSHKSTATEGAPLPLPSMPLVSDVERAIADGRAVVFFNKRDPFTAASVALAHYESVRAIVEPLTVDVLVAERKLASTRARAHAAALDALKLSK